MYSKMLLGQEKTVALGSHKVGLEQVLGAKATHPDIQALGGVEPGSLEAKKALKGWCQHIKDQGTFLGKPLQPGAHPGDGDFDFLRYRVYMQTGNWELAGKVAGKVNHQLNG
jgi:hypothetical protein